MAGRNIAKQARPAVPHGSDLQYKASLRRPKDKDAQVGTLVPGQSLCRHKQEKPAGRTDSQPRGMAMQCMHLVVMSEEEKKSVLMEYHNNPGTGNHNGVRGSSFKPVHPFNFHANKLVCCRVALNFYVEFNDLQVKEPWEVLVMDLIGPLLETRLENRCVLTMTDLYTKWVIAEPLKSKTAAEVSAIMTSKLYMFGMVKKIITDQGKAFLNQVKFVKVVLSESTSTRTTMTGTFTLLLWCMPSTLHSCFDILYYF
uniref:Integrase catalytic domain-containing protein n=1 Tax=Oreochromis niloticus TaxID=8128 RepID=A0A669F6S7_ORENI